MDQHHFPAWTRSVRSLPSRRDVVRALAGSGLGLGALRLSDAVAAKNKKKGKKKRKKKNTQQRCTPNCTERTCGNDGCGGSCGTCGSAQVCRGGACCTPDSFSATCGGRCGTWTNNCGQPVVCPTCPDGRTCSSNGTCAIVCDDPTDCPSVRCNGCSNLNTDGVRQCIADVTTKRCSVTADCPPGAHCQDLGGNNGFCIELCR
jgi:hypothetical protein